MAEAYLHHQLSLRLILNHHQFLRQKKQLNLFQRRNQKRSQKSHMLLFLKGHSPKQINTDMLQMEEVNYLLIITLIT
ncbi:hypothetical protein OX88_24625 [Pseudomonas coronafaciens pv. porri]|nr:hypothetical protein OX88_24625 [Pseudomonas coronafaciens pv. porri]